MGEKSFLHHTLCSVCHKAGFEPNIIVHLNDLTCYSRFIQAGIAIGLGGEYNSTEPQEHMVRYLDVTDFNVRQSICAYYKKQAAYGNIKLFIDFLRNNPL